MPNFGLRRHNMIYKGKPKKQGTTPVKSKKKAVADDSVKVWRSGNLTFVEAETFPKMHFCDSCEL